MKQLHMIYMTMEHIEVTDVIIIMQFLIYSTQLTSMPQTPTTRNSIDYVHIIITRKNH